MPELPEVQILVNQLAPHVRGQTIHRVEVRDSKIELPRALVGQTILGIRRRGKFIIFELSGSVFLLAHLRMTGWFEFREPPVFRCGLFTNGGAIYFEDRRRLGQLRVVSEAKLNEIIGELGPEPLERNFNLARITRTSRPVKVALLDQRLVAGIGNIYASESLWRAKINPKRRANRLSDDEMLRLRRAIIATLRKAITLGEHIFDTSNRFAVYDREGKRCRRCGARIRRIVQAQRSTYFCPRCQR